MFIIISILAVFYIYMYIYSKIVFSLQTICFELIRLFVISKKVGSTTE